MAAVATVEDLATKFGIEAIPDNVKRLAQLVSRQTAPREEIAKLICEDKKLVARLLRAANPRAECEDDYVVTSVESAVMRTGVGCVLLLAMGDPLIRAVKRTFETMLSAQLESVAAGIVALPKVHHVLGKASFAGKATGSVCLRLAPATARNAAAKILGISTDQLGDDTEVDDVIGELTNMVVGSFKSNLCDAGLDCKLSPPEISRTDDFTLKSEPGGLVERMGFRAKDVELVVDIHVDPWNNPDN